MIYIKSLDGFRAFAIFQVVCFHAGLYFWEPLTAIISAGYLGVQLFFILSAFLLSSQMFYHSNDALKSGNILSYIKRRFLRIYPLFFISSVILLLILPEGKDFSLRSLIFYFFFISDLPINGVVWSLFVEIRYYLILPFLTALVLWVNSKPLGTFISVSLLFVGLALVYVYRWFYFTNGVLNSSFVLSQSIANFDTLLLGVSAAWIYYKKRSFQFKHILGIVLILALLGLLISLYFFQFYGRSSQYYIVGIHPIHNICWVCIILIVLLMKNSSINKILSGKFLLFISTISYSVYLWHLPLRNFSHELTSYIASSPQASFYAIRFILTWMLTIGVSFISYKLFERPFLKLQLSKTSLS